MAAGGEPRAGASSGPVRRITVPFTTSVECLLVPPRAAGRAPPPLVVALHGQGQGGERQQQWLAGAIPARFASAFPDGFHSHELRAPGKPIRIGHAWYLFTGDQAAFAARLTESEEALWRLVDAAAAALGSDASRLYLCGFSQGAYLAHCAAVRAPQRVKGWIAQSGRLKTEFLQRELPGVAGKPVLIQHGRRDEHLPVAAAEGSAAALEAHGARVELRLYDAGHEITPEMVADVHRWLDAQEPA